MVLPSSLPACGGDGTVGWILSVMDALDLPRPRPAIGIIPLGTGNDLARSLNWGGKYRDKPLRKVLLDIAKAEVVELDRWSLKVTRLPYSGIGTESCGAVSHLISRFLRVAPLGLPYRINWDSFGRLPRFTAQ